MDISTRPFLDYNDENLPVSLDIISEPEFYSTSPNYSESTSGKNAHSLSSDVQSYLPNSGQFPMENWTYAENFLLQGIQDPQYIQTPESNETEEKINKKSKRISKRAVAKERAKTKQEITSIFKSTETKAALEELDDPNLDQQSKRKQKQMMRNRISAQNSRDRKKAFAQQLEEINGRLVEENTNLRHEKEILLGEISQLKYSESQLLHENQTLKNSMNNMCTNCRHASNQGFTLNHEDTEQNLIDYNAPVGGFSGLASPILSRFPSGRGITSFLTFAAFVSCVVVMNMPQSKEIVLQGPVVPEFKEAARVLEFVDNETVQDSYQLQPSLTDFPPLNPYMLQNIEPLKNYFNQNYELLFKQNLIFSQLPVFNTLETEDIEDTEELNSQAITRYNQHKIPNLRKNTPTIINPNLPIIDDIVEEQTVTSTLFCPSAFEFNQTQNRTFGFPNRNLKERLVVDNPNGMTTRRNLNLGQAEYLQLFVPKNRVASVDILNQYSFDTLVPTDDNDTSMLEIWCKVFLIRELNSSL